MPSGTSQLVITRSESRTSEVLPSSFRTRIPAAASDLRTRLVVTEQVFNLNGLGKLFVESVTNHDYNLTQQLVMLVVLIFVVTNLVVDLMYAWLDPRIRYS